MAELFCLARTFYPSKLENADWLRYYSQIFDYVEFCYSFVSLLTEKNSEKYSREFVNYRVDN
jgi:uncharacterized protein YecE (DUF72 family)